MRRLCVLWEASVFKEPKDNQCRTRETWGKIRRCDSKEGTQLVETLEVFLRCGGHIPKTADLLNRHRHTVRERVNDLEMLRELDLKNPLVVAELLVLGANDPSFGER
ncbi:TPA: helix-turn-helix domain-containing protein [Corynebacterium striatum]|nr:helix-turn-helix domain-containing protein [Corynebacterium striatum]